MMLDKMRSWEPPQGWLKVKTIELHTAGEPFRVGAGGYLDLPGDTILARRRYAAEHLDHLRTALIWEPRGHADMYGCIITPRVSPGADVGVLFMHNEGYSTMCGHGIIALTKVVLETRLLPLSEPESVVPDRLSCRPHRRLRLRVRGLCAERPLPQRALLRPGTKQNCRGSRLGRGAV